MTNELEIEILKYNELFTKRSKDIKKNQWFSFPNELLLHPDFLEITGEELKWFLWCLSVCSKINKSRIRLNVPHAMRFLALKEKDLISMIEKLESKQVVTGAGLDAAVTRPCAGRAAAATLHNNTLQDITLHNSAPNDFASRAYDLWPLKKGKSLGLKRLAKDLKTESDFALFETAAKKYLSDCRDLKYCKHFSTFANEWRDWIEFVPVNTAPASNVFSTARQQIEDIENGKI